MKSGWMTVGWVAWGIGIGIGIGALVPSAGGAGADPGVDRPGFARSPEVSAALPVRRGGDSYVGSGECEACHREEHASWHRSFHRTMTQTVEPGRVLGAFDGTTVVSDGLPYRVRREGERYLAEMPDPDVMMYVVQGGRKLAPERIPRVTLPVVLSTGSHHYQTYWVASPRYPRLLQTLPLVYLLEDRRWIPREDAFLRSPADRGRIVTQWNHHCIRCHSTGGNPGLDDATGQLRSEVGEFGIACEACHGAGGDHVRYRRRLARLSEGAAPVLEGGDRTIVNPARLDARRSSQVCGQCHGVYVMHDEFAMDYAHLGPLFRPGDDLERTRYYIRHPRPGDPAERWADRTRNPEFFRERWWDDGTILAGGREYTAMSVTACYSKGGMSCLSCHAMHGSNPDDQLKSGFEGERACTQCHGAPKYTTEVTRHTFHAAGSAGSSCLNCHMPHTTYALLKGIRSHQIESPQADSSARFGVPNACNLCHLDRTLDWTATTLSRWYGQRAVTLSEEQRTVAASVLWLLRGHAAQRVITAWHVGWAPARSASGADWAAPFLAPLLADDYGVVRYVAGRSLRRLPGFAEYPYDFLASPEARERDARQVTGMWEQATARPTRARPELLLGEGGSVVTNRLAALLAARDRRLVTIKE